MLTIKHLTKRYGKVGIHAVNDVSLTVPDGQVVATIGASGAGKSTLIRCVNRLVEPTEGEIWLNDTNICSLKGEALRRLRCRIGMIFQEYALVDRLTVMENVLSGKLGSVGFVRGFLRRFPEEVTADAFMLLDRVDLLDHVDKRADELSGGQRQRVGIARALLQHPELLLIDEPTASLDPKIGRQIMRLIVELAAEHKLAAVINIHDVALAKQFAQRIIGLKDGKVVFDGKPKDLTIDQLNVIYGEEDWSAAESESRQESTSKKARDA